MTTIPELVVPETIGCMRCAHRIPANVHTRFDPPPITISVDWEPLVVAFIDHLKVEHPAILDDSDVAKKIITNWITKECTTVAHQYRDIVNHTVRIMAARHHDG